jgi:DNA-binding CsgD family transcriptional regulator
LLNRVQAAIRSDLITYEHRNLLMRDLSRLTAREREVMQLLARARDTKQIARELDISPKTAEKHRANVLVKMNVDTVVELVCRLRPSDDTFVGAPRADSSPRLHNGHAV